MTLDAKKLERINELYGQYLQINDLIKKYSENPVMIRIGGGFSRHGARLTTDKADASDFAAIEINDQVVAELYTYRNTLTTQLATLGFKCPHEFR